MEHEFKDNMTVGDLIEFLQTLPKDAKVFKGVHEGTADDGLEIYGLYDFGYATLFEKLRSCRSCLPSSNQVEENVLVFEY
jgi:hypothetical protein